MKRDQLNKPANDQPARQVEFEVEDGNVSVDLCARRTLPELASNSRSPFLRKGVWRMSERTRLGVCALLILLGFGIASSSLGQTIQRGPYLQMATPTGLVVRWRTNQSVDSVVRYGTTPDNLSQSAVGTTGIENEVALSGLT